MLKKILSVALAAMMACTCLLTANAAGELTSAHAFGSAPDGWVDVDDTDFEKITYYNADGTVMDAAALKARRDGGEADGVTSGSWQYFNGGHLRNSTGFNINNSTGWVEFTFTGTAVAWIVQFRHMADSQRGCTIYIDGTEVETLPANPSANFEGDHVAPTIMWQKTDLSQAVHTLKIEVKEAGYLTIDSFSYIPCEVPETPDTPDTPDNPDTGDATVAAIAIAAVASLGAVLVIGKKRG